MSFHVPASLKGFHGLVLLVLGVTLAFLVVWLNRTESALQEAQDPNLPFGFMVKPDGSCSTQDFGCNMVYFRGIRERVIAHPYRLEEQEKLFRHYLPELASGMCHGYSPVAFVLVQPLLWVSAEQAYLVFTIVAGIGILLLFRFHLLPRVRCKLQIYALLACIASVCLITAFAVGQTALITTTFVGFFWMALQRREQRRSIGVDVALAVLLWALCMKPSVAYIPVALLLSTQAWRALAMGVGLLGVTWLCLSGYYGGWWTGLVDYANLLNHYDAAGMTPFMRNVFSRHGDTGFNAYFSTLYPAESAFFFALSRDLFLGSTLVLLLLRVSRRITLSGQFQGMIWTFLLLCPYLVPAEDWLLCLLVVEGTFFCSRLGVYGGAKFLLFFAIMNLRDGLNFPGQINTPLKCALLAWIIVEAVAARRKGLPDSGASDVAATEGPYPRIVF